MVRVDGEAVGDCPEKTLMKNGLARVARQLELEEAGVRNGKHLVGRIVVGAEPARQTGVNGAGKNLEPLSEAARVGRQTRLPPHEPKKCRAILLRKLVENFPQPQNDLHGTAGKWWEDATS